MLVELMVRESCGSCKRVKEQIEPVVRDAGAKLLVVDVDEQGLAAEYGDRVPVVVINGEEFACWEVDNDELRAELGG
ncbi:glutaredoxin family protein [Corynebacterium sp. H130]|uniref:glutaredoxin family protein n=1 Tax=Corynebacterium sp. H130 TaxID=3133444 RepID=UPI0030971CB7